MLVKRIQLKNYRRYRDADIEFPTGLIGIVGKNGAGKSTLIEAIGWCLYGNNASRTTKDQIKTSGIDGREECSVSLDLEMGSDTLQIKRILRGRNSDGQASLFVNGNKEAEVNGMREVSEYVVKRTGMDHVTFFTSIFAKQKELDLLSNKDPSERKRIIMRLLKINKIDDAISAIKKDIRTGKEKIDFYQNNLKDIEQLEAQSKTLHDEKQDKIEKLKEQTEKIKELFETVKSNKKEFSIHMGKYRQYNKTSKELTKITTRTQGKIKEKQITNSDLDTSKDAGIKLQSIKPDIEKFQEVKRQKTILDSLYGKFKDKQSFEKQLKSILPKIKKQEATNKKTEKNLEQLKHLRKTEKSNQKVQKELEVQKAKLDRIMAEIGSRVNENNTQKDEFVEEFSNFKQLGEEGNCPTCKRPLKDHFSHVTKYYEGEIAVLDRKISQDTEDKQKLETELGSVKKNITDVQKKLKEIDKKKKEQTSLQTKLKGGKKIIADLKKDKTKLEKNIKRYQSLDYNSERHSQTNKQFTKLNIIYEESLKLESDAKRIPTLTKRLEDIKNEISQLASKEKMENNKLSKIGFDENKYDDAEKELKSSEKLHHDAREKRIELKGEIQTTILRIKQTLKEIQEEKDKRNTIEEETKKIGPRSKLEKIFNEFKLDLISRIRPIISQRASELFSEITKGKYPSLELDGDYNILIEDEGGSFTTDRFSGGEEDLANLCLRIAISQELTERAGGMQANFIALDEIFGSQDEERKNNILKALSELSKQFRQILIITHVEDVKETLPYVFTIKEDSEKSIEIKAEGIIPTMA